MAYTSIPSSTHRRRLLASFVILALLTFVAATSAHAAATDLATDSATTSIMSPEAAARLEDLQVEMAGDDYTFSVGYNAAMEYSLEQLCGAREPEGGREDVPSVAIEELSATSATLPSSYDLRRSGGVTTVKDQLGCGSCWAFATVGPLESQIRIRCGTNADISEQYLVSCNLEGYGCGGGWFAHWYHFNRYGHSDTEAGAVREASFTYRGADAPCGGPYTHPYKLSDWNFIGTNSKYSWTTPTIQQIKQAIYSYGAVGTTICVGSKFRGYTGGIFNVDEASVCHGGINHAVVLVGWNDDEGTDKGYWILKNSWGSTWGERGYMNIRYGMSSVGYGANYVELDTASCPTAPAPDPTAAIKVRRPNGGKTYVAGAKQTIQWTYRGDPGESVNIRLLRGNRLFRKIADKVAVGANGAGSFVWTIPAGLPAGNRYRVKVVSSTDSAVLDVSDGYFSIRK
jgi:C1A family cysteine protease